MLVMPPMSLPSFFKVIHDQEQKEETRIPKIIASSYWQGLSNPILVRLPNGDEWNLLWEKRDDDIWLHKNWKSFAQFYSLKFGSLLVFKFKGNSLFKVKIFQNNMVEIEYPSKTQTHDSEGRQDEEVEESDEECEMVTPPLKKRKTNSNGEAKSGPSQRTNNKSKTRINVDVDATHKELSRAKRGGMVKARNCSKAEAMKISENPSFVVNLTRSYVQQNILVIPTWFTKKHLKGLEGTATVGVGEDLTSTWDVSFKVNRNRARITGNGWKSFSQDNNLQVGDACTFEMIQHHPATFKVNVQPSSEQLQGEPSKNKRQRGAVEKKERFENSSKQNTRVLGNSGDTNIEPDKFKITVKSARGYPSIPQEFMKKHSTINGKTVKLKVGKRRWKLKVMKYGTSTSRLSDGWRSFKRAYKLNFGDICEFEMIDEEKLEFKVSITKVQQHREVVL